jgi:hypothetical protein
MTVVLVFGNVFMHPYFWSKRNAGRHRCSYVDQLLTLSVGYWNVVDLDQCQTRKADSPALGFRVSRERNVFSA